MNQGQRDEGKAEREEMGEGLYLVGWDCGVLEVHSQGPRQKKKKRKMKRRRRKGKQEGTTKGEIKKRRSEDLQVLSGGTPMPGMKERTDEGE